MDTSQIKNWYLDLFKDFEKHLNGEKSSPVHKVRRNAIETFADLDFPNLHQEDWRFTDISPILKHTFSRARREGSRLPAADQLSPFLFGGMPEHRIVFVDGFYSPELSSVLELPKGTVVGSLANALKQENDTAVENISRSLNPGASAFTALNTAFAQDGAFIHLPKNAVVEQPVHILFLVTSKDNLIVQPRNLVITGANSRVNIVEHYASLTDTVYFTNTITEYIVGENSNIDVANIQSEHESAYHVASTVATLAAGANFVSHGVLLGASIYRHDVNVILTGEGGSTNLEGLYLTRGEQLSDTHTMIDHAAPRCTSQEHFKGILDGKSRGVFNGKILVRKGAQQTNSYQENRNIILSNEAKVDTKPQLEIFADDVKCSHGATVGQLSEESLFYLRARGIGVEQARLMLIYAFANDVLKGIKEDEVRSELAGILSSRFLENVS